MPTSPPGPLDPQEAFRIVFELFDASVAIKRKNLLREHPEEDEAEIERLLRRWLMKTDQPLSESFPSDFFSPRRPV